MRLLGSALALLAWAASSALGQAAASLSGTVEDTSGARVAEAEVTLWNSVTAFRRVTRTASNGSFHFANVPFHSYELKVAKAGFLTHDESLSLRSNVPVAVTVKLGLEQVRSSVTVEGGRENVLVDPEETGTHAQMNQDNIDRMALVAGRRGLESVLASFPGFAQNANGAVHPRGSHNQMTFVIDGMPISDQLTGAFANAVDPSIVETIELFTGDIAAEYGNKTAAVANISTRSGLGTGRRAAGSFTTSAAGFDTLSQVARVSGETGRFGYTASVHAMKSNRYLDQVSLDNLHNGGNSERGFTRLDYQAGDRDSLRLNLMAGRSSFQLANLRSQHAAGQDQRQTLEDFSASLGWMHVLNATSTFDSTASYRTTAAQLWPSPQDTPVTAAQARHLSTLTFANRYSTMRGAHNLRAGIDVQHFPVSENFSFAATSPAFNDPASDGYIATLAAFDLSRGGRLFQFSRRDAGNFYSAFVQDNVRLGRFHIAAGLRYDNYRFLVRANQMQPRLGASFHIRETGTVLRASYNRLFQTPPNENLLISNSEQAGVLVEPGARQTLGGALVLIRPERQDAFEAGVQQALANRASLNVAYHHKRARDQQDNDNFFNTGIIFPISLSRLRVNGLEARLTTLPIHGFSSTVSLTHSHAVVTPPFTGGLFIGNSALAALNAGPFVIDHDQKLSAQVTLQYSSRRGFWSNLTTRYDSGLVSNPSDPAVVARDADYSDLLPYVDLLSNPPRVKPRTVVDVALGYEHKRGERRLWEISFELANLTNKRALYNFQSIFVGTRLVGPRTAGLRLRWYW
jgi:hypothetical protein